MLYARAKEAIEPVGSDGWVFSVLTLDINGYFSGKPLDSNAVFRALAPMTRAFLQKLGRRYGAFTRWKQSKRLRTVRKLGNRWMQTVEVHKSGVAHVNLLLWCPELAAELCAERDERMADPEIADAVELVRSAQRAREPFTSALRETARKAIVLGGDVLQMAEESGWGRQSTAEEARGTDEVTSYIVKLAGKHDETVGEIAKNSQLPMNAPARTRRLRSGKEFLPPRHENPNMTGVLLRERASRQGDREIYACNATTDPTQQATVALALKIEERIMREEEDLRSRGRGKMPPMPPVRFILHGVLEGHKETSERLAALAARDSGVAG